MDNNTTILALLKLHASLLELHGENDFKVRSYHSAVFNLEKSNIDLMSATLTELEKMQGLGKAIAAKIFEIQSAGSFKQLDEYLEKTPQGLLNLLDIKGLGTKKIRILWQELNIDTLEALWNACEDNRVAQLKGFGEKTQDNILQALLFKKINADKMHYADAERYAGLVEAFLKSVLQTEERLELIGHMRRKTEVIEEIEFLASTLRDEIIFEHLDQAEFLQKIPKSCGMFVWRGTFRDNGLRFALHTVQPEKFVAQLLAGSAADAHLAYVPEQTGGRSILSFVLQDSSIAESESELYEKMGLPLIIPPMREGLFEFERLKQGTLKPLIETKDLKGIFHAHSTYSDGKHELKEMALACQTAGYAYLGISDHSKAAFYANGLSEERVLEQHLEIEELNRTLAPFKIFKGIEADILSNGDPDYGQDFLKHFDFVIVSVHSALKMNEQKATQRLIKAIENPYTTMLGHPTGRLLLRREGYPLDFKKIIDACASNKVIIEINASPWRLDLDWRHLDYAINKGVFISINPDAHQKEGIHDVYYGVCVAQKGGLTKEMTFNTLPTEAVAAYFEKKKSGTL